MARSALRVGIIADDLTGACDAALEFVLCGADAIVYLTPCAERKEISEVTAITTLSRDVDASAAREIVQGVALRLAADKPEIIFKKIDSTMRGHVGVEVIAAAEALQSEHVLITPAFPQMGRKVRGGLLYIDGDQGWKPIDVLGVLRKEGIEACLQISRREISNDVEGKARYISIDATSEEDLNAAVAEMSRLGGRILYAGSAGLARAVAGMCFGGRKLRTDSHERSDLPCAFLVGSTHPVTVRQLRALKQAHAGRHVTFPIVRGETRSDAALDIFKRKGPFAALFLSGGDTATMVLDALGARAIEIKGQVATGLPWGRLRGGPFNGLSVATKSGGFGGPNDLIKVADFFTCQKN